MPVKAVMALATAALAAAGVAFPRATVRIDTGRRAVTVRVEVARAPAQITQGLMGRRSLAPNAGMLFLFARPTRERFWMKDTLIPLSIAFADRRGRIVRILDMPPCRVDPCPLYDPGVPVSGALEVNRGAFARWRVHRGARITLRR
jgi:uncharacterized membrane protein (UPF0127 family)